MISGSKLSWRVKRRESCMHTWRDDKTETDVVFQCFLKKDVIIFERRGQIISWINYIISKHCYHHKTFYGSPHTRTLLGHENPKSARCNLYVFGGELGTHCMPWRIPLMSISITIPRMFGLYYWANSLTKGVWDLNQSVEDARLGGPVTFHSNSTRRKSRTLLRDICRE